MAVQVWTHVGGFAAGWLGSVETGHAGSGKMQNGWRGICGAGNTGLAGTNVGFFGAWRLYGGVVEMYGEVAEPMWICVGVWRLWEPRKCIGERRLHMGKAARICGDCQHGGRRLRMRAARLHEERKSHGRQEYEVGVWSADFVDFWQYQGGGA